MEDFRAKRKKNSEILTEVLGGFYFKITLSFGKKKSEFNQGDFIYTCYKLGILL